MTSVKLWLLRKKAKKMNKKDFIPAKYKLKKRLILLIFNTA